MDHTVDGEHGHDHHHDHGHSHSDYFTEQLFTIFISGAFGVVGILLYRFGMLVGTLAPEFLFPVFLGGLGILAVAVLRGVIVWKQAGQRLARAQAHSHHHHHHQAHTHEPGEKCDHPSHAHEHHDHKPGEKCDHPSHAHEDAHTHTHGHHDHDHADHDHSHGMVYARIILLCFPLLLFCLSIPNPALANQALQVLRGEAKSVGDVAEVADKETKGDIPLHDFASLIAVAQSQERREVMEGTKVRLQGQFRHVPGRDKEVQLYYSNMKCCITDVVNFEVPVILNRPSQLNTLGQLQIKEGDMVEVVGKIQFAPSPKGNHLIPVLFAKDEAWIKK